MFERNDLITSYLYYLSYIYYIRYKAIKKKIKLFLKNFQIFISWD